MRVVTLVPWRDGDELREQSWGIVRPHLESLGFPITLGDSVGDWARGRAINAAAREAGRWDVALITDADTILDTRVVRKAIALARRTGGGVRPHDRLWRLTPSGSIAYALGRPLVERHLEGTQLGGGALVVAREGWDRVGGYDSRFTGWGHEDTALNIALLVKADWDRISGEAYHLWHPNASRRGTQYRDNRRLMTAYHREHRDDIKDAESRKGWKLGQVL